MKRISVHKIIDHILRCGDIDNRYVDSSVMADGARAHRKLQKEAGGDYRAEVSLSIETQIGGEPFLIEGRADGVYTDSCGRIAIHEIKTTTASIEHLAAQNYELHIGQAKCYAHMLLNGMDDPPQEISVLLTYYQLESGERKDIEKIFTRQEIRDFFIGLLERYSVWVCLENDWKTIRDASIKQTVFPFTGYRKGQREFAVGVYRTIEQSKKLYIQAPTGVGKTVSTIFPSVKAMGEDKCGKLFYLTAKTVTRTVAEEAVELMLSKGLRFKSVTLRAKDKICFCEETNCNPEHCRYARGHYNRINAALLDILENNDLLTPSVIEAYAQKHCVCPFEFALDASLWADMVIGDYNHVFDPVVYLKRFFAENVKTDYVFLIDEAHNLADRVRDMYTVGLYKSAFLQLKRELKDKTPVTVRLKKSADKINTYFLNLRKELNGSTRVNSLRDTELDGLLLLFCTAAGEWLDVLKNDAHPAQKTVLELYFEVTAFLGICELYDSHYTAIEEIRASEVSVTLFCLDPSDIIAQRLALAKASILFSATLTPLPYFKDILGGETGDACMELPSPFDNQRLLLLAHRNISTKYNDREKNCLPIAQSIHLLITQKSGNYLVFFPSFEYMRQVANTFCALYPEVDIMLQDNVMSEQAREDFVARFDKGNQKTLVGFCVLGGIFSEGINLEGERLIGSVIVGVGLPKLSLKQDLIRNYFDERNGMGYDYAYVFPGMNKVLQAAGRVIRSQSDYGVVLLLDSRFNNSKYRGLYPRHWSHIKIVKNENELEKHIKGFEYFKQESLS